MGEYGRNEGEMESKQDQYTQYEGMEFTKN